MELLNREDTEIPQRLKTVQSWTRTAREAIEDICPIENMVFPRWVDHACDNLVVRKFGDRTWRNRPPEVNNATIREWLELEGFTIVVATDGSLRENLTAWGGAVWRDGRVCFEWATGRTGHSSSYRSECEAFGDALVWLESNTEANDSVAILTDSLSLVTRLEKGMVLEEWNTSLRRTPARITVTYVPGHCGIKHNEMADRLAGQAEAFGELILEPNDVLANLWRNMRQQEIAGQSELWSTQRLVENGWEYGDGRHVQERGAARRIFNQRQLGVQGPD